MRASEPVIETRICMQEREGKVEILPSPVL
jgi:hypothetical protein